MTQTALVLGCASQTPHGRDQMHRLSEQARRRGLRLIGADTPENLAASSWSGELVDELQEAPVHDVPGVLDRFGKAGVDAAVTFRERCVEPAAELAAALGVKGPPPETVATFRDKDRCREALRRLGYQQPASRLVWDEDEARAVLDALPGPWVCKPRDGMGSVGVSLLSQPDDLDLALRRLEGARPFVIEEFVEGREFSVEGIVREGDPEVLAVTEKATSGPPAFVETGHLIPAPLPRSQSERLADTVARAVADLGLTAGVFHVEAWLRGGDVILGEAHARVGGDFIHALVEYVCPGLELYGALFDDLLGGRMRLPPASRAAGVRYLDLGAGIVGGAGDVELVAEEADVLGAGLLVRPGQQVQPAGSSGERHGYVIVGRQAAESIPARLEELVGRLRESVRVQGSPVDAS